MGKQGGISLKGAASAMVAKLHKVDVFSEIAHHGVAALAAVADEVSSPVLFFFLLSEEKALPSTAISRELQTTAITR